MCRLVISTTKYRDCPATCTETENNVMTAGCPEYAKTGVECAKKTESHLGATQSRQQCQRHRDEGYADRNTR